MLYKLLSKITRILAICAGISVLVCICFYTYTVGAWSWEEIETEYIGTVEIGECISTTDKKTPYTVNIDELRKSIERNEEENETNCFEIRSQSDWEYVKEVLGVEEDIPLDFPNYYVLSLGWELDTLTCQRVTENSQEVAEGRSQKKADSYQEGVVHIYRMDKNVIIKNISER